MAYINIRLGGNTMTKNFWRVRLGAAKKGHNRYERVYNLCKNEKPPCIAVGWGEIDLSQDIDEIANDYESIYEEPFRGKGHYQIKRWFDMKKGNYVIAMIRPATICGIGEIIRKRYHEENENFKIEIEGYDNPGEVWFFNRIDVDWITSPDKYIKVRSLGLPKHTENILLQIPTIINIERNDYNLIKEKMDAYEPEESPSPSKFKREYDTYGKSSR